MRVATSYRSRVAPPVRLSHRELGQIQVPVLLVVGEKDPTLHARKDLERALRYILMVQLVVLPGVGRMVSTKDPSTVNRLVLCFLGESRP